MLGTENRVDNLDINNGDSVENQENTLSVDDVKHGSQLSTRCPLSRVFVTQAHLHVIMPAPQGDFRVAKTHSLLKMLKLRS
jgi:hypothetical protein